MSVLYPKDCLAYHLARPLFRKLDCSSVPSAVYAAQMVKFEADGLNTEPYPETDAIEFYQLNHALALIQQKFHPLEPLPAEYLELVERFFTMTSVAARRALFYLIVICTRETRHLQNKDSWKEKLKNSYNADVAGYVCSLPDNAQVAMAKFKSAPPKADIGPYVQAIYEVFYHGTWGGGYGGKAWATVTDCLGSFITGQYSLVMLLDTVWTLCHNNGPIFNKGDLYKHYMGKYLTKILDVQRAGMIPIFIDTCKDEEFTKSCTPAIRQTNAKIMELFDLPRVMDWDKVNELGAVGHYNSDGSVGYKPAKPKTPPKPPVPPADLLEVYPGFHLAKIKVLRAA